MEGLQSFRQSDETDIDVLVNGQKDRNVSFASLNIESESNSTSQNLHDSVSDSPLFIKSSVGSHSTNHVSPPIHRNESSPSCLNHVGNGTLKVAVAANQPQPNAALAFLSMPCRTLGQLKTVIPYLVDHTIISVEERVSKRLTTKYKDKFLERCSPDNFAEFEKLVRNFVQRCRALVRPESSLALNDSREQLTAKRSPLIAAVQLQTTKFITCFHETCSSILRYSYSFG